MKQSNRVEDRKVAVFDLDGTITYRDTYVDFLLFCLKKRPARLLRSGALVAYYCAYKTGLKSNHWLKAKFLGTIAGGLGGERLDVLCEAFAAQTVKNNIKPQALQELKKLKQQGYVLVLATASFEFYVSLLFKSLDMDHLLCTKALFDNTGITGALDGKNCIGAEKARQVESLLSRFQLKCVDRAYSDDKVDLPLFKMAKVALVIDPKPATALVAGDEGYQILKWR